MKLLTKLKKKNNKGFSLVELIVVILIMAIIAVALAPQVIKWVNTASENTESNNIATLESTMLTVVAEWTALGGKLSATTTSITLTVTGSTVVNNAAASDIDDTTPTLQSLATDACVNFKATTPYTVTISSNGEVTVAP